MFQIINPATEQPIRQYEPISDAQVDGLLNQSQQAFEVWCRTPMDGKQDKMMALIVQLKKHRSEYAALMTQEMGKPIQASLKEIDKCVWVCQHYVDHAADYLKDRQIDTDMTSSYVSYQPLGAVFAIMPWNYPFWQVFRFLVPNLMAGNVCLLKHAPNSLGCGKAIEQLVKDADFPDGVFKNLIIDVDQVANVIASPVVQGVTLTGSEQAGRSVGALAGQHLKRVVLELGGNDPYLVLADADIELTAQAIVTSRLSNTGQVCIAAKRVIVDSGIADKLTDVIQRLMSGYQMEDPMLDTCQFGPMARDDLRAQCHQQVQQSVVQGAQMLMGGFIPDMIGYYYPPTLLTAVEPGMVAFDEELFGPVVSITTFESEAQGIALANQSRFGLGGAVFSNDVARAQHIATEEIETGTCFVNRFVTSDPRLPFGGIKQSGVGRELAEEGILAFMNTKTIGI